MAITKRDSNLYKDVLVEAVGAAFAGKRALAGTGAAILVPNLPTMSMGIKLGTGSKVQIPYFDSLGELEDVVEGQALTPRLLSSTQEESVFIHSGIAAEVTDWASIAAQAADPYTAIADQFTELAMRRIDQGLIDKAKGTALVLTTGASIVEDNVTDARFLWGDEDDDVVLMVAHSKVMRSIRRLKDSTGRLLYAPPEFSPNGEKSKMGTFNGIPLMQSDRLTPDAGTPTVYPSLLLKKGALVAWYNGNPVPEEDRDILTASNITALHLYHIEHMYKRPKNGTKPGVVKLLTTEV